MQLKKSSPSHLVHLSPLKQGQDYSDNPNMLVRSVLKHLQYQGIYNFFTLFGLMPEHFSWRSILNLSLLQSKPNPASLIKVIIHQIHTNNIFTEVPKLNLLLALFFGGLRETTVELPTICISSWSLGIFLSKDCPWTLCSQSEFIRFSFERLISF